MDCRDDGEALNLDELKLVELPPLPPGLRKLKANNNMLNSLPEDLPHTIEELHLRDNCLLDLPQALPYASLVLLDVRENAIEQLPESLSQLAAGCKVYLNGNQIPHNRIDALFDTPQDTNGLRYPRQRVASALPPAQHGIVRTAQAARESRLDSQANDDFRDRLGYAVYEGNTTVVKQLLQKGTCDINAPWEKCNNYNLLGIAVEKEHFAIVKLLLEQPGLDPNGAGRDKCHPLTTAILKKRTDILDALLGHPGIDPNHDDHSGVAPLYVATQNQQGEMVKRLLKHPKTNPNLGGPKCDGNTPLTKAAYEGYLALVQALLNHRDIDPNLPNVSIGATPLYLACQQGHETVVAALLKHPGIQHNPVTRGGQETPLHVAAYKGHLKIVRRLLAEARVDASLRTATRETLIYLAAEQGHAEIIDCLLQHKEKRVDPNLGKADVTPLIAAVMNGHEAVVSRLLAEQSVLVNKHCGPEKTTALLAAIGKGTASMVRLLLRSKAVDPNLKITEANIPPLQYAVTMRDVSIVQALLDDPRVDISAKNSFGGDAFSVAVELERAESALALIERGASIGALPTATLRQSAIQVVGASCLMKLTTGKEAQTVLDRLKRMPPTQAAQCLVAIAMQSALTPAEKALDELPMLKQAITLNTPGLNEAVSGTLAAWGAASVKDRSQLPRLTRDMLTAWGL
ncbi:ankyrin repeat domain-containing protein [Noviherbaspirillum sp. DKR-6]|uniref:Ankyrin repeat domain-containing protein n=2 Tax=Noviherbaspirillum pedocola TaxID=2801341 RepID=A0A934W621_9BURK|nr:ankyrin repeat domain-containing protein [Noviherbaspirillum pedocola]